MFILQYFFMVTVVVVMHLEKSLNKGLCITFITEILVYCMVFIIISSKNRWIFFPFLLHGVFCIASQVLCCNRGFFFLYDRYTSIVLFRHWRLSLLIFFFDVCETDRPWIMDYFLQICIIKLFCDLIYVTEFQTNLMRIVLKSHVC